ncbi:asparaginase [Paenibacillus chungangensis]|uniref:asparaginase n=1 Tax=Paenibacillus chungangensis TaxID=696535 RepID=A0ABW3HNU3_9BACL
MKRILVVFTGGTIGSKASGDSINVHGDGAYALLEAYVGSASVRTDVGLETIQPLNLLSENITPGDWTALAASIRRQAEGSAYDGIVVTHGSDTLAYTAAMMGYLFADIAIPLVLTASNYPIADARSNGLRNFSSAIDFIAGETLPGVFVVYENAAGISQVYLGTRLMQCEPFTDQFRSPYDLVYGHMEERRFRWHEDARNPQPDTLRPAQSPISWNGDVPVIDSDIVYVKPYPGLDYSLYTWTERKPKAVLHDLHHSGTACGLEGGAYSLPAFIKRCAAYGIDVYIAPVKNASDAMYASSHQLIGAGAIMLAGMSVEAALTKLMLAYGASGSDGEQSKSKEQLYRLVKDTNWYYEIH